MVISMGARRCPICGERTAQPDAEAFPFCSRRCKLVDLGNWLGEHYRMPETFPGEPFPADYSEDGQ
jgi:uncharacterized protein